MSRILLADSSPHAQRMGGEILRQEGFTVETVADGTEASAKLTSFDPLVVVADAQLPLKSGYEISKEAKARIDSIGVLLTLGTRAPIPTAEQMRDSGCDSTIGKPFEATALVDAVKRLAAEANSIRASRRKPLAPAGGSGEVDRERVEAAVTLAMEAALPALIQEITERVLIALKK